MDAFKLSIVVSQQDESECQPKGPPPPGPGPSPAPGPPCRFQHASGKCLTGSSKKDSIGLGDCDSNDAQWQLQGDVPVQGGVNCLKLDDGQKKPCASGADAKIGNHCSTKA